MTIQTSETILDGGALNFEVVTDGLGFPEGPVWMEDGSVVVVEVATGLITRVLPDGRKETVADCGGGPGGAAVGPDGWLYICNNGGMSSSMRDGRLVTTGEAGPEYSGGWIDRIHPVTGEVQRLYEETDGRRLAGPNDIVFDKSGGFWFSDFGKPLGDVVAKGGIFYAHADGSSITRVVDGPRVNGIGLSPDGRTLYAAISHEYLLVEFDVLGPVRLDPVGYPAGRSTAQFAPRQLLDSLAVDAQGNICVATVTNMPGIGVVDPGTGKITMRRLPDPLVSNICFGGADMQDAWITMPSSGRLIKTRWDAPGLRLAFYA